MYKRFAILFLVVVTCFSACREDNVAPEQEKCKKIMHDLPTYKQKSIDLSGRIQQNGTIMGYFDGKDLKMAVATSFSQTGRREENYFFHNNHLIAVHQEDYTYNKPQYITEEVAKTTGDSTWYDDAKTIMKTNWFYYYNDHLVKWIDTQGKIVSDNDKRFDYKEEEFKNNAEKLKEMLLSIN
jgi:hypothetical protein